jgi:phosphate transport system substrate-binding protein
MNRIHTAAATLILALLSTVTGTASAQDSEITLAGSTTIQPVAELLGQAWEALNPGVTVTVSGGGSSVGVTSIGSGTCDIGMASREITEAEMGRFPGLRIFTIARDGIAIITSPDNQVTNLSRTQVRDIFTGDVTNWSEVGGSDTRIVVVSREEGSGTRSAFEELVLSNSALITGLAILQPSNGAVMTTVSTTPGSVGYVSFGYLNDDIATISVNGVAPTPANAVAGRYPIVRPLNMLTNGAPSATVQAFLDFILGPEGQAIVVDDGYLSIVE